jgi:hypothetical protein
MREARAIDATDNDTRAEMVEFLQEDDRISQL